MTTKSLCALILLFSLPFLASAQSRSRRDFADRLLLGAHYGYAENFREERDLFFEREHYANLRAGISLTPSLYAGIQSRFIRARNFETDFQSFYMAGVWTRGYLLHPRPLKDRSLNRIGAFLEAGFSMGNYAFDYRTDGVQYYFQRNGNWYIPMAMGIEYRLWRGLTLEGSLNMIYNNGGNWDKQGFAYLSLGANYHL
jgi:hypothetical protein